MVERPETTDEDRVSATAPTPIVKVAGSAA
jgi:hypothetical protein